MKEQKAKGAPVACAQGAGAADSRADANEYTQIVRNSSNQNPAHDKNGNMTSLPTRPATGANAGVNTSTTLTYDAFNRPFSANSGGSTQEYRYDALGRRIVVMVLSGGNISSGRRFIWDGWSVATERLLSGTTNNCDSLLERCYVDGADLDEHLFVAIDGNTDGALNNNLNVPVSASSSNTNDYEYYYLQNRLGNVMGLLDAGDHRYMLEFYRYTVWGEATVLPLYDTGLNQIEDTPTDLTDNNSAMLATRTGGGGDATAGRASTFNNQYTFTGRYLDAETGLHYFRYRYYESRTGRFISRDPAETPWENLYSYSNNSSTYFTDPMGLGPCARYLGAAFDSWLQQQKNSTYPLGPVGCRRLQDGYDHALKLAGSSRATVAGRDEIGSCLADITQAQLSHGCIGPDKTDAPPPLSSDERTNIRAGTAVGDAGTRRGNFLTGLATLFGGPITWVCTSSGCSQQNAPSSTKAGTPLGVSSKEWEDYLDRITKKNLTNKCFGVAIELMSKFGSSSNCRNLITSLPGSTDAQDYAANCLNDIKANYPADYMKAHSLCAGAKAGDATTALMQAITP